MTSHQFLNSPLKKWLWLAPKSTGWELYRQGMIDSGQWHPNKYKPWIQWSEIQNDPLFRERMAQMSDRNPNLVAAGTLIEKMLMKEEKDRQASSQSELTKRLERAGGKFLTKSPEEDDDGDYIRSKDKSKLRTRYRATSPEGEELEAHFLPGTEEGAQLDGLTYDELVRLGTELTLPNWYQRLFGQKAGLIIEDLPDRKEGQKRLAEYRSKEKRIYVDPEAHSWDRRYVIAHESAHAAHHKADKNSFSKASPTTSAMRFLKNPEEAKIAVHEMQHWIILKERGEDLWYDFDESPAKRFALEYLTRERRNSWDKNYKTNLDFYNRRLMVFKELVGASFAGYATDPVGFKADYPMAAKLIRLMFNKNKALRKDGTYTIQFANAPGGGRVTKDRKSVYV